MRNQGYTLRRSSQLMPVLVDARVLLLEQPLARGREADLDSFDSPIPLAADESVQGLADIEDLVGRFDVVNIKLDKCGGLTEALLMVEESRRARAEGDGGQHGRHQSRDGAGVRRRPALRLRRSRRADLPRRRPHYPVSSYDDGTIWCPRATLGLTGLLHTPYGFTLIDNSPDRINDVRIGTKGRTESMRGIREDSARPASFCQAAAPQRARCRAVRCSTSAASRSSPTARSKYSARAIKIVERSLVIDMLAPLKIDFTPEAYADCHASEEAAHVSHAAASPASTTPSVPAVRSASRRR